MELDWTREWAEISEGDGGKGGEGGDVDVEEAKRDGEHYDVGEGIGLGELAALAEQLKRLLSSTAYGTAARAAVEGTLGYIAEIEEALT